MSIDMRVVSVPADGDCLYHAFIKGLNLHDLSPKQLRDFVADKILSDKDLYEDIVTEWVDFKVIPSRQHASPETVANRIRNTKEWATSTVIHILAHAFNVRVIVFQKINGQFYSEVFPSEWKGKHAERKDYFHDIYLYRKGCHFELLMPLDSAKENDRLSMAATSIESKTQNQRGGGYERNDGHKLLHVCLGLAGIIIFIWTF